MNTETQTQAATADPIPAPSPAPGPMTEATLAGVLKKSRQAQRASNAAATAPNGTKVDARTDNGSPADSGTEAQGQPAPAATADRTDDSKLEEEARGDGQEASEEGEATPSKREEKAQKRWDKLTAQLKAKDAELAELRAKVGNGQQGQANRPSPAPGAHPLAGHPQLAPLDQSIAQARAVLVWAEENPEGGEILGADGQKQEVTAAQVRRYKAQAQVQLTDLTAQRAAKTQTLQAEYQQKQAEARAQVERDYPEFADPESEVFQEAVEYLQTMPPSVVQAMQALPDSRLVLADLMAGRRARLAKAQAKPGTTGAAKAQAARPTPQPGRASSTAPRVSSERKEVERSKAKFESSGRVSDFRDVLANRRRAARTAA